MRSFFHAAPTLDGSDRLPLGPEHQVTLLPAGGRRAYNNGGVKFINCRRMMDGNG
jgi:hypothetical protein